MPDTGFNLWWARNDGMSGHVWISPRDMARLREEMAAQGLGLEIGLGDISAAEIGEVIEDAQIEPLVLDDARLWGDWLRFLEGAAQNGGLVVR